MHRFINSAFDLSAATVRVTEPDLLKQWQRVLRFQPGDTIVLADGSGQEASVKFVTLSKQEAELQVVSRGANQREPKRRVHLYAAVLKRENFDWLVQKAVEAGVHEITPLITERTVKLRVNLDRLQRIAREAAEQSGRSIVPVVREAVELGNAVESVAADVPCYVCEIDAPKLALKEEVGEVALFVGPEGGWGEKDRTLLASRAKPVGLGSTVLRAETAGIIAAYLAAQG